MALLRASIALMLMTMANDPIQPLQNKIKVVNDDGTPTDFFIRWAQQRQIDIQQGITLAQLEAILSATDIIPGTGLSGGGNISANVTLSLADTAVTPGTYGDATHVPQITVDQQGRLTGAVDVAISGGSGGLPLIGTVVSTGVETSLSFNSIPASYNHLLIMGDHGSVLNNSTTSAALTIQFNGDTGANYLYRVFGTYGGGGGTGFGANSGSATSMFLSLNNSAGTSGVPFGSTKIDIFNYIGSQVKKAIGRLSSEQGNIGPIEGGASGWWNNTSVITDIVILDGNGNAFASGSTFWLYGY